MAKDILKLYRVTKAKLDSLTKAAGQLIVVTDTEQLYLDTSSTTRILLYSGTVNDITASGSTISWTKANGFTETYTLPSTDLEIATTEQNGLMSAADKTKLDSVANSIYYIVGPDTDTTAGVWTGTDERITEYYDGLTVLYTPAIAGAASPIYTSLNINGLGALPCYYSNTTRLTTHYTVGTPILFTCIDNCWKRADYDSNTNTQIRVYRQTSGYNADYPLIVSRTAATSIGTSGTNSSYSAVYGVMNNDTTKIPTANPNTGEVKAVKFTGTFNGSLADNNTVMVASASQPPTLATGGFWFIEEDE